MLLSKFIALASKSGLTKAIKFCSETSSVLAHKGSLFGPTSRHFSMSLEPFTTYEGSEVVPDVVKTAPKFAAAIKYNDAVINMGNELTPTLVKDPPTHIHWPTEENAFYTLCFTDPDAPRRDHPKFREWNHWLVVNIPETDISSGTVLYEYIGSAPPFGTGLHRYVFLIYKQPGKLDCDEERLTNRSGDGRGNFRIADFAKKYNLGNPIAGNFFHARWDAWVSKLCAKLAKME